MCDTLITMDIHKIKKGVAWCIGTLLLLTGITEVSSNRFLSGILIIISSIFTIPYTFSLVNSKLNGKINPSLRYLITIITFFVGMTVNPSLEVTNNDVVTREQDTSETKENASTRSIVNTTVDEETQQEKVTVVSVTDGDTIRVDINGENKPVRLIGINTPELSHPSEPVQCYSQEAKKALENLILNKEVTLEIDISETDKYNRLLRYIWIDEILVNEYMTQNGYAFSSSYPPDTKYQSRIKAGEDYAKANSLGLWAEDTCKGDVYTGTYKDPNKVAVPTQENTADLTYTTPFTNKDTKTPIYTCNCKKTCAQMSSCEEAQYQLNVCGCTARDADKDGVACDTDCQ
jgi:micrococcal nuclease